MVALEALFGEDKKGRKNYVRSRPAALVGRTPEEVTRIEAEADRLYKLRNMVVHSGGWSREPSRAGTVTATELLRCCLGLHLLVAAAEGRTRIEPMRRWTVGVEQTFATLPAATWIQMRSLIDSFFKPIRHMEPDLWCTPIGELVPGVELMGQRDGHRCLRA